MDRSEVPPDTSDATAHQADEAHALLDAFIDAAPLSAGFVDRDLRYRRVNRTLAGRIGLAPEEILGRSVFELHPAQADLMSKVFRRVLETGEPLSDVPVQAARPHGVAELVVNYFPVSVGDAAPIGVGFIVHDVTAIRRAAELQQEMATRVAETERAARERIQLLADASSILSSSPDVHGTLDRLARLIVPRVADWCFIDMPDESGHVEPVIMHHEDAAKSEMAMRVRRRYPIDPDAPHGTGYVLRTGQSEVVPEIPPQMFELVAQDAEHLEALRSVALVSHISVPLHVRDRKLGVLTLAQAESGRRFTTEDVPFYEELARKAAVAVDNARLFEEVERARQAAQREADRADRLQRMAASLNEAATMEQVAAVCVHTGLQALGAVAGSLAVLDEDATGFEVVSSEGYADALQRRWRRFELAAGRPLSDAVLRRAPVVIESQEEWQQKYPTVSTDLAAGELRAYAAIPVVLGRVPLAALSFSFSEDRTFTAADLAFLSAIGEMAAQALERGRLLENERRARAEAEHANRAKTEFLSAMSHELRTPLNAISGYVDLLSLGIHGPVNDAQLHALERIRSADGMLLSLINDVLNFARVEAGRLDVRREPVQVLDVLTSLDDMIAPQVEERGHSYTCVAPDPELRVLGDAERIRQVLLNLLSNAIKFTGDGGRISVSAARDGEHVAFTVADNGRGIPAERMRDIFDPFIQLNRHRNETSQQGVGLGLAISRELARAMHGNLTVQSTPGEGSTFTLTLPAA